MNCKFFSNSWFLCLIVFVIHSSCSSNALFILHNSREAETILKTNISAIKSGDYSASTLVRTGWLLYLHKNKSKQAGEYFLSALEKLKNEHSDPLSWTGRKAYLGLALISRDALDYSGAVRHSIPLLFSGNKNEKRFALHLIAELISKADIRATHDAVDALQKSSLDGFETFLAANALKEINQKINGSNSLTEAKEFTVYYESAEYPSLEFLKTKSQAQLNGSQVGTKIVTPDGWIRSSGGSFNMITASGFLTVREKGTYTFIIESRIPLKLSIGKKTIFTRDSIRNNIPEVMYFDAYLPAGDYPVTCFSPASVTGKLFRISLVSPEDALEWKSHLKEKTDEPDQIRIIETLPAIPDSSDPAEFFTIAENLWSEGWIIEAKTAAESLLKIIPDYAGLQYLSAMCDLDDRTLPLDTGRERAGGKLEQAVKQHPEYSRAFLKLGEIKYISHYPDSALQIASVVQKLAPESFESYYLQFQIYREKGWDFEARKSIEKALNASPNYCQILSDYIDFMWERNLLKEKEFPEKYTASCPEMKEYKVRFQIEAGDYDRAKDLILNSSLWMTHTEKLAQIFLVSGQFREAEKLIITKGTSVNSETSDFLKSEIYYLVGETEKSLDLIKNLSRNNFGSIVLQKRAVTAGIPYPWTSLVYDGSEMIRQFIASQNSLNMNTSASSLIILDHMVSIFNADGSSLNRIHQIIRVNNREGILKFGEVTLPENAEVVNIRAYDRKGIAIEPEEIFEKESISISGLEPGYFIEIAYIYGEEPSESAFSKFQSQTFLFRSFDAPMILTEYCAIRKGDFLKFYIQGDVKRKDIKIDQTAMVSCFSKENQDQVWHEPLSVHPFENIPLVRAYFENDSSRLSDAYSEKISGYFRKNHDMKKLISEISGQNQDKTDLLKKIYYRVIEDIYENTGHLDKPASYILAGKSGDRILVLKALLDTAGLKSRLILSKSIDRQTDLPFTDIMDWTYPLVMVQTDKRNLFLDPSFRFQQFGYIPPIIQAQPYIDITPDGMHVNGFTSPYDMDSELCKSDFEIRILEGGIKWEGTVKEIYSGIQALAYRNLFLDKDEEKIRMIYATVLQSFNPNLSDLKMKINNLKDPSKPLEIISSFSVLNKINRNSIDFNLLPSGISENYLKLASRETKFLLNVHIYKKVTAHINMEKNIRISSLPHSSEIKSIFGNEKVKVSYSINSSDIDIEKELKLPVQIINPADYGEFSEFIRKIENADKIRIPYNTDNS